MLEKEHELYHTQIATALPLPGKAFSKFITKLFYLERLTCFTPFKFPEDYIEKRQTYQEFKIK